MQLCCNSRAQRFLGILFDKCLQQDAAAALACTQCSIQAMCPSKTRIAAAPAKGLNNVCHFLHVQAMLKHSSVSSSQAAASSMVRKLLVLAQIAQQARGHATPPVHVAGVTLHGVAELGNYPVQTESVSRELTQDLGTIRSRWGRCM